MTTEERNEIILLCGGEGYTTSDVADEFNYRYFNRLPPITYSIVGRLLSKSQSTENVADAPTSGRPRSSAEIEELVLAKVVANPRKSTQQTSLEVGNLKQQSSTY